MLSQAVIIAGGKGTRFRSISDNPKILMPLGNIRLIDFQINYLKKNNISKAEPLIKRILQTDIKNYGALRDLGYIEYLKENIENANITLKKIVNKKTTDPFALNIFGNKLSILVNIYLGEA